MLRRTRPTLIARGPVTLSVVLTLALCLVVIAQRPEAATAPIPTPEAFVGHPIGADRRLVAWPKIVEYFEVLAANSDRLQVVDIGKTTQGNRMIAAVISAPANLASAQRHRETARRLTDPRSLDESGARALADSGKAIVALTLNIHAPEIASSQMALELGYRLVTDTSAETVRALDDVILLLIPSLNPDGQIMVSQWYEKYIGTDFEGGRLPWLYHAYAGHDNNRDWFMLNLTETRQVTRFLYHEWHPQAIFDQHQQGASGARMFIPPYFDPVNPNVHPLIWRQIELLGAEIMTRHEEARQSGVVSASVYDGWRPGDMDTTPWWHNVVGLISEAASVRIASPIVQRVEDLTGNGRGLERYEQRMNYPNPWPGGTWRLRDIVDYELTAAMAYFHAASKQRPQLLMNAYRMNRDALERGRSEPPYAFVIPTSADAWTARVLAERLSLAGVEVDRATESFDVEGVHYEAGSYIVSLAQPLRPYVKDLLEAQHYPNRSQYPGGPPEPPYDEAGWTLPLKMGLEVRPVMHPLTVPVSRATELAPPKSRVEGAASAKTIAFSSESAASAIAVNRLLAAGARVVWSPEPIATAVGRLPAYSFAVGVDRLPRERIIAAIDGLGLVAHGVTGTVTGAVIRRPRVGLYQPWGGNMDEGWTRLVFDNFEVPYTSIHNEDIRAGSLIDKFDAIVLPSMSAYQIMTGENSSRVQKPTLPPPYAGGLEGDGVAALVAFVRSGGTLVALDGATQFAIDQFKLPVKNVLGGVPTADFFCPGSILAVSVDRQHFITGGLPASANIFFNRSPAFEVTETTAERAPKILARYGKTDLLRSGWLRGEERLSTRAALVEADVDRGHIVLVGFRSQFRAQTYGTFRVLFNSLFYAAADR